MIKTCETCVDNGTISVYCQSCAKTDSDSSMWLDKEMQVGGDGIQIETERQRRLKRACDEETTWALKHLAETEKTSATEVAFSHALYRVSSVLDNEAVRHEANLLKMVDYIDPKHEEAVMYLLGNDAYKVLAEVKKVEEEDKACNTCFHSSIVNGERLVYSGMCATCSPFNAKWTPKGGE